VLDSKVDIATVEKNLYDAIESRRTLVGGAIPPR
jgi:hypothetical protein